MKKILLGSVATGALIAAGSAHAADLGRPVYKAPPVVAPPAPIFSWTGCFVGAHGGWGWGRKEVGLNFFSRTFSGGHKSASTTIDTDGAIFGGQIGCDYQFGFSKGAGGLGAWVIGIQGDFAGARLTGDRTKSPLDPDSTTNALRVRTDWLASITGRLGFTGWIPQTLLYIRGGGAWVRDKWDFALLDGTNISNNFALVSETRSGWTIGGGIEYAVAPNWSVFAEFNHYDFGNKTIASAVLFTGAHLSTIDAKQRIEAVRLGVNYRFNWLFGKGKAPVVARY